MGISSAFAIGRVPRNYLWCQSRTVIIVESLTWIDIFVFARRSCITWIFSSQEVSHIFQWLMGLHAVLGRMLWWYIIRRTVWFTLYLQRHDGLHSMQLLIKVLIKSNGVSNLSNQLSNFSINWGMQCSKTKFYSYYRLIFCALGDPSQKIALVLTLFTRKQWCYMLNICM